ncbi:MAG: purine-binding chemotaxis protein CheW [Rhodoferax sp.]|nr:purine-binding chemotaxis protein CheW [Rhodoferax sp.]
MNATVPATLSAPHLPATTGAVARAAARGHLYLKFTLGSELFAIDIQRIREIIEYTAPSAVPMMPESLLGVINVRGSVVPVIDLAKRFGWAATVVGRRTSIVIVEIAHKEQMHVLGLLVDRVNAVGQIANDAIEPVPAFGASIKTEFIAGIAKSDERFVIVLSIERTLSIDEIAMVASTASHLA